MNATHDSNLKASALKNNFVDEFQHPKLNFDQKSKSKKDAYQDEISQHFQFKLKPKVSKDQKKKPLFKKAKNLQLKPSILNVEDKPGIKSNSNKYKDLISKKIPTQGGIINAAIA